MEVVPGLHLIDGLTTVNVYAWERPDGGLTLIDAGMPGDAEQILAYLDRLGRERLDRVIITHADIDHVGGLARIKATTGARVICHAVEKDLVEGRQQRRPRHSLVGLLSLPLYWLVTKVFLRYSPVTVDDLVVDKERLPEGFQVVHTPGHTPGQIALYEPQQGLLIVGDTLANRNNKLGRPAALFTPQMDIAEESIRKLARLPLVRVVCFGHGPPLTEQAAERLQAFAASL